nr:putative RNA-directed DNA polymerase, eukaryota, reverse transcriptase zinc-binding domain protein [Tanacetum cinerariifolium]
MGSYRSREDDVSRISTSIFITNFPDLFSAKDLFHSCKQYGHVVDTFIPSKRSKAGKRFGFIRFVNVFNVERLVNNLCTIWVDRFKFYANIARFHKAHLNGNKFQENDVRINRSGTNVPSKDFRVTGTSKLYVHVVKGNNMSGTMKYDSIPAIVLDDECLYSKDLSKSLLGRVEIEGIPFKLWSENTFKRIAAKWGELLDVDDQEEMCFHSKRLYLYTKSGMNIFENFKVIFRGKVFWIRAKEVPGWVPNFLDDSDDKDQSNDALRMVTLKFKTWVVVEMIVMWQSDSVGNSGGILCVWDPNSFHRINTTISDYFIMIWGVWLKTGVNLLIVAVYAPHNLRDKHTWSEVLGDDSNTIRSMMRKLKYLKVKIREWNNGNRNNTKRAIEKYKEELEALDATIDKGNGSDEIVNKMMELINSMHHIDKIQSMDMAQKAKIKWSIEGDENSRFFHGVLNKKRSQLNIHDIMVDGVWTENPNTNKHEFLQHFRRRFDKTTSITIDQHMDLERDVFKEELKRAVWDYGTDKSPGPDGFTFGFYRHFWSTIKNYVFEAVKHFFTYGDIPKGCNSSFIDLIPKIPDANLVKDFRPISLIGSIYKIIAKILANRLVGVLGDIVNEVDFKKAYDSVRWDFLDDVLKKFGFVNKWCAWIQSFLRSLRGSIIINGSPTEEFQFFKGLKQGDPLSPFLFILIIESLHLSFQRVVDAGMFMGIKLSPSLSLSHMFYTNDAVFVGQWYDGNINILVHVLECFYQVSGLRINMSKSKIMRVHVEDEKVKYVASKCRCLILNTPFSYLGTKVGVSMSQVQAWKEVVDK